MFCIAIVLYRVVDCLLLGTMQVMEDHSFVLSLIPASITLMPFLAHLHEEHRAIVVTSVVPVYVYVYVRGTLLVKVFRSLYLLNMQMYQVDTLHIGRYWSEVLCSTIMTHPG